MEEVETPLNFDEIPINVVDGDLSSDTYRLISSALYADVVGVDIETSGLDYIHDRIATVQVYSPACGVEIIRVREGFTPNNLVALLEGTAIRKIFHYGMFDLSFLAQKYGVYARNLDDTRIAATIVDPYKSKYYNPARGKNDHGLAALVWTYYHDRLDKELAVSDWFGNLTPAQLSYASKDVIYLPYVLSKVMREMTPVQRRTYHAACMWLPGKVYQKVNNLPDPFERY